MNARQALFLCLLALGIALPAWASTVLDPQSTLFPYRSTIAIQDDFIFGTVGSGNVGNAGWTTAGTVSIPTSETNRFGIYRFDTSAVAATQARLTGPISTDFDPALPHILIWAARLNTNDANTTIRIGAQNPTNGNPPAQGIFLEKLDADTNWFCVARSGGVQTRVDSTVAITTNFITATYTRNSSGVQFAINNVNVCSLITTNIPTAFLTPESFIINSAAASKTFDVDYFQIQIYGIVR